MSVEQKQNFKQYQEYLKKKTSTVVELEINARYQKATFETMFYALEAEKIKDSYNALLEQQKAEAKEEYDRRVAEALKDQVSNEPVQSEVVTDDVAQSEVVGEQEVEDGK